MSKDINPGTLVTITDHINLTGLNPLIGETGRERFVDMSGAYDRHLQERFAIATGQLYDAPAAQQLGLVDLVVPRSDFDREWRELACGMARSAPGATRAVKSVIAASVPSSHPELEAGATDAFARLWTADAHWAAVEQLEQKRRTG